jgi:hypothetical protein
VLWIQDVDPGSREQKGIGFQIRNKELSNFTPKKCYQALGNIFWDVYPRSGFSPILDPAVEKATDPGSGSAKLMQCIRALKDNSALVVALRFRFQLFFRFLL